MTEPTTELERAARCAEVAAECLRLSLDPGNDPELLLDQALGHLSNCQSITARCRARLRARKPRGARRVADHVST